MTQSDVKFIDSMPEFHDRHLGALFFQPYADDLADRNVSTTLIHPGAAFRLDSVATATGLWAKRSGRHGGVCGQA